MTLSTALLHIRDHGGEAVLLWGERQTVVKHFIARMGTSAGGGIYNDYERYFKSSKGTNQHKEFSFHELTSNDWTVRL